MAGNEGHGSKIYHFLLRALCVLISVIVAGFWPGNCLVAHALPLIGSGQTENEIVIEDDADLLTDSEENDLLQLMQGLSEYGNVMFKTVDDNRISVEGYAKAHYQARFADQSGVLFLIDTGNGETFFYCCGKLAKKIPEMDAETVTYNVREDAVRGDYFACAGKAFTQAERIARGTVVSKFTKYTCNICLGLLIAMLLNFVAVNELSKLQRTEDSELIKHTLNQYEFGEASVRRIS